MTCQDSSQHLNTCMQASLCRKSLTDITFPFAVHNKRTFDFYRNLWKHLPFWPAIEWYMSRRIRKPTICIGENKKQISFAVTAKLISAFVFSTLCFLNPKVEACTVQFVSDLVGTQIVGFLTASYISLCEYTFLQR